MPAPVNTVVVVGRNLHELVGGAERRKEVDVTILTVQTYVVTRDTKHFIDYFFDKLLRLKAVPDGDMEHGKHFFQQTLQGSMYS